MRFPIKIVAAFAVVSALTAPPAHAQFTGPTQDYTYSGCIDTRACYLLTVTIGPINNPNPNPLIGDHGATLRLESWYFERGFSYHPIGIVPFGVTVLWDDAGFATKCHGATFNFEPTCLGYASDNLAYGGHPEAIFQNYVVPTTMPGISATFVSPDWTPYGQGSVLSTGSTQLVLTPEPSSYALMAGGLVVLGAIARRRRQPS